MPTKQFLESEPSMQLLDPETSKTKPRAYSYCPSPFHGVLMFLASAYFLALFFHKTRVVHTVMPDANTVGWDSTLTNDTLMRLELARQYSNELGDIHYAFRNDTIMRINLEREAHKLPLIDLHQAFGHHLPAERHRYTRTCPVKHDVDDYDSQPETSGDLSHTHMSSAAKHAHEEHSSERGLPDLYLELANRNSLALGALARNNIINVALGRPLVELPKPSDLRQSGDAYINDYWASSLHHGDFWPEDQARNQPNFKLGGQENGYGYTTSHFHKLHCIANLRTILAFYMLDQERISRDINVHAIHCLEYLRWRELKAPDMYEEPIDTVDYLGMGIH